jgi:hypothetical protein
MRGWGARVTLATVGVTSMAQTGLTPAVAHAVVTGRTTTVKACDEQSLDAAVKKGGLPKGLSLNVKTGAIGGKPSTAGTSAFTVRVRDSAHNVTTDTETLTLKVTT